jgi:hypothetical protein
MSLDVSVTNAIARAVHDERARCLRIVLDMAEHRRKVAAEWNENGTLLSRAQFNQASGAASALAAVAEMIRSGK